MSDAITSPNLILRRLSVKIASKITCITTPYIPVMESDEEAASLLPPNFAECKRTINHFRRQVEKCLNCYLAFFTLLTGWGFLESLFEHIPEIAWGAAIFGLATVLFGALRFSFSLDCESAIEELDALERAVNKVTRENNYQNERNNGANFDDQVDELLQSTHNATPLQCLQSVADLTPGMDSARLSESGGSDSEDFSVEEERQLRTIERQVEGLKAELREINVKKSHLEEEARHAPDLNEDERCSEHHQKLVLLQKKMDEISAGAAEVQIQIETLKQTLHLPASQGRLDESYESLERLKNISKMQVQTAASATTV